MTSDSHSTPTDFGKRSVGSRAENGGQEWLHPCAKFLLSLGISLSPSLSLSLSLSDLFFPPLVDFTLRQMLPKLWGSARLTWS